MPILPESKLPDVTFSIPVLVAPVWLCAISCLTLPFGCSTFLHFFRYENISDRSGLYRTSPLFTSRQIINSTLHHLPGSEHRPTSSLFSMRAGHVWMERKITTLITCKLRKWLKSRARCILQEGFGPRLIPDEQQPRDRNLVWDGEVVLTGERNLFVEVVAKQRSPSFRLSQKADWKPRRLCRREQFSEHFIRVILPVRIFRLEPKFRQNRMFYVDCASIRDCRQRFPPEQRTS